MSYTIEYRHAALVIPGNRLDDGVDRFVICIEAGSSNCYESSGRRSRSWQCTFLGTHDGVLEDACSVAQYCEGGNLKINGSDTKPEAYISRIENLMKKATPVDANYDGSAPWISLQYACKVGSDEDNLLWSAGIPRSVKKDRYDETESAIFFENDDGNDYRTFFRYHDRLKNDSTHGWHFTKCSGPRR